MDPIFFYSEQYTPRHQYIILILEERWGIQLESIQSWGKFIKLNQPRINYSHQTDENSLQIIPHGLLSKRDITVFDYNVLEMDPLAMIFFLLSRYEEYNIKERDEHKRIRAASSYLFKTNRLQIPLVDQLLDQLKANLLNKFSGLNFKSSVFQKELTIDIDTAFQYQNKSMKRFIGANMRDVFCFRISLISERTKCYFKLNKDSWDVYDDIKEFSILNKIKPIIFVQIGKYGKYDKNLNHQNGAFRNIIKGLQSWSKVGLHPSYNSNENLQELQIERIRLNDITNENINISRQHYIRLELPTTYRNLINLGITDDYTMGFADNVGFRAGTSIPFLWYDLLKEEITNLKIHPFCAMDVTLKNYLKLNIEEAEKLVSRLKSEVQIVGGTLSIITHNESLSDHAEWKGWKELLLNTIK